MITKAKPRSTRSMQSKIFSAISALSAVYVFVAALDAQAPSKTRAHVETLASPRLEGRLAGRSWIMGDAYTIADMAVFPWVRNLVGLYEAGDLVGIADFPDVMRAFKTFFERPAVVKGIDIPSRG